MSDVFDRAPRGRDRVSTATALAMFRDELTALGFAAEDVRELVLVACEGEIRGDGRKIHDAYLFEVKKPSESKHPGDFYTLKATIPAAEAFRPLKEGGCPLVSG